jgi:flagellar motor switch protein FliM
MSTSVTTASQKVPIRKYELGRPIIRREQRIAFEEIHRDLAKAWSDSMAEYLPADARLEFEGLDFEVFSAVSIDDSPYSQIALFSIAATPINGFLMMSGALAKFLVRHRLGMTAATDADATAPFTRIEGAIGRETSRSIIARLSEAYAAARLGSIANIRECDDLADSFIFEPDESLALLKFRIRIADLDLRLLVALSGSVVASLAAHQPVAVAEANGRNAIINVVRRLPLDLEVVLGSWKASIAELQGLRAGDQIVLPDGEDAWLAARGVRVRRAGVEIGAAGASVEIRGGSRLR